MLGKFPSGAPSPPPQGKFSPILIFLPFYEPQNWKKLWSGFGSDPPTQPLFGKFSHIFRFFSKRAFLKSLSHNLQGWFTFLHCVPLTTCNPLAWCSSTQDSKRQTWRERRLWYNLFCWTLIQKFHISFAFSRRATPHLASIVGCMQCGTWEATINLRSKKRL